MTTTSQLRLASITTISLALVVGLARTGHTQPGTEPAQTGSHEAAAPGGEAGGGEAAEAEGDPSLHFNLFGHTPGKLFDYIGKDEFGGPKGDGVMVDEKTGATVHEEEPMSPPFVFMLLNFGVLLIILGKYGRPAARKLAEDRHDQIKTALDDAAKLRTQAADKLSEYEQRIKNVDAEMQKLMDGIRADAEADKARILAAAETQAAQMKRDAELRIAAEIELARAQLTQEVTAAAAVASTKLLREKTTPADHTKLVSTFVAGLTPPGAPGKDAR